jgi:primosomal protein N' (replication factor Y)
MRVLTRTPDAAATLRAMTAPLFGQPARIVVRVALPVPIDSLFSYFVPDDQTDAARPGCRALVTFSGRRMTGVIVDRVGAAEHTASTPVSETARAETERIIDDEPVLSEAMIGLLSRAASEVLCPIGIALSSAIPAGSAPRVLRRYALSPLGETALASDVLSGPTRQLVQALSPRPATLAELSRRIPQTSVLLPGLLADGLIRRSDRLDGPSARVARVRIARIADGVDVEAVCQGPLARAPRQADLLRRLDTQGESPTGEIASGSAATSLRALVDRGFVIVDVRHAPRDVLGASVERDEPMSLSAEQATALTAIEAAIQSHATETFLLHGVTGSGKTEVYLRAIARALAIGRQALVLVPEISLTHQIVARLRARFGDGMAVLHSGLRPGERLEQWVRLRAGATPIACGARSALFAPLENLGLIVIDEEHDSAYKNEEGFRYHARRLAEQRSALAGCPLVLGTATPALETRHRAERREIERLVLPRRIAGRAMPRVEMVDMGLERERAARGRKLILSRPLRLAIERTLGEGGQTILFLNRRGFSTQIFCFDCGFAERCSECDVALVYHATEHALLCHYCDLRRSPPERCGGCGNPETALLGVGTERLEEEVRARFPGARLARLDRDTAARRGHVQAVLASLRAGQIDILIGTQMIAKGHDFPGVRLVGVVAADLGLHMPDFRAAERTFQLLTQVAGRAGRADDLGRVVVQTFVPDHYAMQPVPAHDYERFYADEIGHRQALGYPPFGRLTQVIVSARDAEEAMKAADALAGSARAQLAREIGPVRCEVLGPVPAPLPRLRGRYRHQVIIKGLDHEVVMRVSRHVAMAGRRAPRTIQIAVDVDPVNML